MHPSSHRRDGQLGTLDSVPRALLFAAAMAIGCSLATVAIAAADDKAKAAVEAPSKAAADPTATVAPPTATVAPPAATAEADATQAKPDSTERKRGRRGSPRVRIGDDDFESFNEALHTAPWVVGLA